MTCVQIIAPAPLLTIEEARRQVRRDDNDDDAYLLDLIAVVSEALEGGDGETRRSIMPQLWELRLDGAELLHPAGFDCGADWTMHGRLPSGAYDVVRIALPYAPLISVESVVYRNDEGKSQPFTGFDIIGSPRDAPLLAPSGGVAWPPVSTEPEAVRIRYWAGFAKMDRDGLPMADGNGGYVPAPPARLKQAALLHLAHLYEYRAAAVPVGTATTLPMGYEALVGQFRVLR